MLKISHGRRGKANKLLLHAYTILVLIRIQSYKCSHKLSEEQWLYTVSEQELVEVVVPVIFQSPDKTQKDRENTQLEQRLLAKPSGVLCSIIADMGTSSEG